MPYFRARRSAYRTPSSRTAGADGFELERAPDDFDRVPMRELREGGLEAPLADIAPGANDVGPDIDAELLHGVRV